MEPNQKNNGPGKKGIEEQLDESISGLLRRLANHPAMNPEKPVDEAAGADKLDKIRKKQDATEDSAKQVDESRQRLKDALERFRKAADGE